MKLNFRYIWITLFIFISTIYGQNTFIRTDESRAVLVPAHINGDLSALRRDVKWQFDVNRSIGKPSLDEFINRVYFPVSQQKNGMIQTLKPEARIQTPTGEVIRYVHTLNGIPVFRSGAIVHYQPSQKKIRHLINEVRQVAQIQDKTEKIDSAKALQIGLDYIKARDVIGHAINKVYFPSKSRGLILSWKLNLVTLHPEGDWEIIIDASDGEILQVQNRILHAKATADGQGKVYDPDPVTMGQASYGWPYVDNNDQTNPVLDSIRSSVVLKDLSYHDGKYWLEGPYVRVTDIESPGDTIPASSDPAGFQFTRNQQGFEAVMVYYHIDKIYRYLLQLGFSIPTLEQFRVDPHGLDGDDNSHYVPSLNYCAFGTGGVDDAEDAEVIWHEYEHAIQDNLSGEMDYTGETLSLVEGSSDYWAVSYARSVSEYKWYQVFKWDGHNEYWAGREANLDWVYPQDYQPAHAGGQIWSSALMKVWEQLGKEITDKLFIYTHLLWGTNPGLRDAARAFLMADKDLYDGTHWDAIYPVFKLHGLVEDSAYAPQITHSPLKDQENIDGPFSVEATVSNLIPDISDVKVYYAYDDTLQINSLSLTSQDSLHYSGSLPGTGQNSYDVFYRIEATNSFGVTSSFPETGFLSFHVGVDTVPPVIQVSYPDSFAIQQWPLTLQITVFDNVGVDSVFLYSALNDTSQLIKTQAINVGNDGYEVQFPQTGTLQDNDYIYFKLRTVDAGSQHNVSFAPVAGFYRIRLFKADGYILIVQDDVPDTLLSGKTGTIRRNKAAINASSNVMKNILQRHRFAVDIFSLNEADINSFSKYDLIIHSAGGNTRTLIRDDYRTALQDWILASPSHKCLFEGGELFYNWFAYAFGQDVLHLKKWISDDGGELSLKTDLPGYSFLNSPYTLPSNIVLTGNGENIRDVVTITSDAVPVYHWQNDTSAAALYLFDPDPDTTSAQMVYMPFDLSSVQDTLTREKLLFNLVTYLLKPENPPSGKIVLNVFLKDSTDHSGTEIRVTNPYYQRTFYTPASGQIVMDSLYAGDYVVRINHPTFSPSNLTDTLSLPGDTTLIRQYTLIKNPYQTILEGTVLSEDSLPLPGAVVTVIPQMNSDTTDSTGAFRIPYLSPGKIEISIQKDGYVPGFYADSITSGETLSRVFVLSKGYFNDFESGLNGIQLSGEFEIGESLIGSIQPHSGQKIIGLNLKGNYSNNQISEIRLPSFTLTDYTFPQLHFYLRHITEATYDGMHIIVRDAGTGKETLLIPERGYNTNSVYALGNKPGFSGDNREWELVQCDLSDFIGKPIEIILRFASDESIVESGVYIDDLGIKDEEISIPVTRVVPYYTHGVRKVLLEWAFERRLQLDNFSREKGIQAQPPRNYKLQNIQVLKGNSTNNLQPIAQWDSLITTSAVYQYEDTTIQFNQNIFYSIRADYQGNSLTSDTIQILVKDTVPLLYEDFESTQLYGVPRGWTVLNRDSGIGNVYIGEKWEVRSQLARNDLLVPVTAHSGNQWMGIGKNDGQPAIPNKDFLITPEITASGPVTLEFFAISTDNKQYESLGIGAITSLAELDSGWTPDTIITDIPSFWKRYQITLSPKSNSIYVVFYYGAGKPNFVLRLDDIAILSDNIVEVQDDHRKKPEIISQYILEQNYPNPFNPGTDIPYAVPQKGRISIHIYNVLGQRIRTLFDGEQVPGRYMVHWDGKDNYGNPVPSGVYFYSLEAGSVKKIRKMLLIR